jgi:hypothetical protein
VMMSKIRSIVEIENFQRETKILSSPLNSKTEKQLGSNNMTTNKKCNANAKAK